MNLPGDITHTRQEILIQNTMTTDIGTNQTAVTRQKPDREKRTHNLPEYLRYVARKSRAGFDKVHDELTRLYTTEKASQRRTVLHDSQASPDGKISESQATSPKLEEQTAGTIDDKRNKRMSLRKQWARSGKTKTIWASSGRYPLPTAGSFVSYISEDVEDWEAKTVQQKKDIETLKEELQPRRNSSENVAIPKSPEFGSKSYSANQVVKETAVFKFDKLSVSKSLDFDQSLSYSSNKDRNSDECPEYINIQGYSSNVPLIDTDFGHVDDTYDVPKASLKPPVKPRKGNKPKSEMKVENEISKRSTIDDDYVPMDEVDDSTSAKEKPRKETVSDNDIKAKTQSDGMVDSGDYMLPDICNNQPVCSNSGYTGLNQNGEEHLYTAVNKKVKPKGSAPDTGTNDNKTDSKHTSDSGDYVLPVTCKNTDNGNRPGYTGLDQNRDDTLYTSNNKTRRGETEVPEVSEDIYANCTSALYDDFDNLTENDVLARSSNDVVYDVLSSVTNSSKHVTDTNITNSTNTPKKTFYEFSVAEVIDCLNACALPHLASICEEEQLDGHFFENFNEGDMIKEPFLLNWFHIAKLRRIIAGWRPKR